MVKFPLPKHYFGLLPSKGTLIKREASYLKSKTFYEETSAKIDHSVEKKFVKLLKKQY